MPAGWRGPMPRCAAGFTTGAAGQACRFHGSLDSLLDPLLDPPRTHLEPLQLALQGAPKHRDLAVVARPLRHRAEGNDRLGGSAALRTQDTGR